MTAAGSRKIDPLAFELQDHLVKLRVQPASPILCEGPVYV